MFIYEGFDSNGKRVSGELSVKSKAEAGVLLAKKGIAVTSIKESQEVSKSNILFRKKVKESDFILFTQKLALYLENGVEVFEALSLLSTQQYSNESFKNFINQIITYVKDGNSFASSLQKQDVFLLPEFFIQSVKVGEENGFLAQTLRENGELMEESSELKKKIRSALIYPSFIIFVAVGMIGFMLTSVVPKIVGMYENNGQELPGITQVVIDISDFLRDNIVFISIAVTLILFIHFTLLKRNKEYKYFVDKNILKIPIVGTIVLKGELSKFAYTFATLLKNGVVFSYGIKLSSKTLNNTFLKTIFEHGFERVIEGANLSDILKKEKAIPVEFTQNITLGEKVGEVPKMLKAVAKLYSQDNKNTSAALMAMLEPFLMLFVGSSIGVIVIAMLLPIFALTAK